MKTGTALITGASAGIGRVYALELAKRGQKGLILAARREEKLRSLETELRSKGYGGAIEVRVSDLRDHASREALIKSVSHLDVSLLINNAGFGYVGRFLSDSVENQLDMITTNCSAPLHLTHQLLPKMISRGQSGIYSGIINVASVAAFPPLPFMTTYGATKSFLLNWSVGLREELRGQNVRVLALCPGPTESDFHLVAGVGEKIALVPAMTAETVVEQSLDALENDRAVEINGWKNWLIAQSTRFFPKSVVAKVARGMISDRVPSNRR